MAPLIPIALQLAQFIPGIIKHLGGEKAEQVASTVVNVAEAITGTTGDKVIDALKADPALLLKYQSEMLQHQTAWATAELQAQRDVIVAEAQSESWLTRNWRPLTMVTFVLLIVNWWMGWVKHGEHITEEMVLQVLDIVQYGLSGYVVGRSAEKIAPYIAALYKRSGA